MKKYLRALWWFFADDGVIVLRGMAEQLQNAHRQSLHELLADLKAHEAKAAQSDGPRS